MVSFRQRHGLYFRPQLKRLQELQAEIFQQLQLLIPEHLAYYDSFQSRVAGSPLLKMDILERHRYTRFMRLTYEFEHTERTEIAPDAHIRMYQDARLAEVTSFNPQQGCKRLAHPAFPPQPMLQHCWRQNLTLGKWLSYLLHQGHNVASMRPAGKAICDERTLPLARALS